MNLSNLTWDQAFQTARQSLSPRQVDDHTLALVRTACATPQMFTTITRLFYRSGKTHGPSIAMAKQCVEIANASPYALSEWMGALHYFVQWLTARGRPSDLPTLLGYLNCCIASAGTTRPNLILLLSQMLETYGFVG